MVEEGSGQEWTPEMFVLGEIPVSAGVPDGDVVDIDADPEAEPGERTRVIKPYRWWTGALVLVLLGGIGFGVWNVWASGRADFGSNSIVTEAHPVGAFVYSDGRVEVMMKSSPVRVCGGSGRGCEPNQIYVSWRDGGTLVVGAWRESPDSADWAVAEPCDGASGSTAKDGSIVLVSPSGEAARAVVDYFTGDPVSLTQSTSGEGESVPVGVNLAAPGACVSS